MTLKLAGIYDDPFRNNLSAPDPLIPIRGYRAAFLSPFIIAARIRAENIQQIKISGAATIPDGARCASIFDIVAVITILMVVPSRAMLGQLELVWVPKAFPRAPAVDEHFGHIAGLEFEEHLLEFTEMKSHS